MVKNGEGVADLISKETLNLVCARDPFLKQMFLEELTKTHQSVIYLDFDLLYSGYVKTGVISQRPGTVLQQVCAGNLVDMLARTYRTVSQNRCLVIVDSLNGLYSLPGMGDSGRMPNSYVMMLAAMAEQSGSRVVCSCMLTMDRDLTLSPLNIPLMQISKMCIINLKGSQKGITADLLRNDLSVKTSVSVVGLRFQTPL